MTTIIAYTDGACKGNGKQGASAGGYGAHICYPNGDVLNVWGGEPDTTNNRMELLGSIIAIQKTPSDTPLQLWTDSSYVQQGITKWITGWKQKNWKTSKGDAVKNQDLWQQLDALCQGRKIDWQWIKGHDGHAGNEMADSLANLGVTDAGEAFIATQTNDPTPSPLDAEYPHQSPNLNDFYGDDQSAYLDSLMMTEDTVDRHPTNDSLQQIAQTIDKKTNTGKVEFIRSDSQNPDYDGDTSRVNPDFWAVLPKPINRGKSERQLIMDTETTGFEDQKGDRIVEVGIVELVGRKFTGQQLHVYINPDKIMGEEVMKVHGISNEFLSDKPRFEDVAADIYEFMKGAELIAHNATFDMRFLNMEFDRAGFSDFSEQVQVTDSLAIAKELYPGQKNNLNALVSRLDVGKQDRTFHGALLDSEILAEVYLAMTGGQISLMMDDTPEDANQEDQEIHFLNLSELAHVLVKSAYDGDADSAWRGQNLS